MQALLNENEVEQSETGIHQMYASDVMGPGSVVRAVRELLVGRNVIFAVCDRLPEGSANWPTVRELVKFAPMPGAACIRYAAADGTPDGAGSSTVYGCGSMDNAGTAADLDPVTVAAYISATLAQKSHWFFLMKTPPSLH